MVVLSQVTSQHLRPRSRPAHQPPQLGRGTALGSEPRNTPWGAGSPSTPITAQRFFQHGSRVQSGSLWKYEVPTRTLEMHTSLTSNVQRLRYLNTTLPVEFPGEKSKGSSETTFQRNPQSSQKESSLFSPNYSELFMEVCPTPVNLLQRSSVFLSFQGGEKVPETIWPDSWKNHPVPQGNTNQLLFFAF